MVKYPIRHPIKLRRKLLYATIATLCFLVALEGIARLVVVNSPNARWNHHRRLIVSVGFPTLNDILEADAETFWRLKPNVEQKHLEGNIADSGPLSFVVTTNEHGCRAMPSVSHRNKSVLFLGDSCTFGVGVDGHQTFAERLQTSLPEVQCVNAGVPGYSAYQGKLHLQRQLKRMAPDVVVLAFLFNDMSSWDNMSDMQHAAASKSLAARMVAHSRIASLMATWKPAPRYPSERDETPRLSDEEYSRQIQDIVDVCRANSAQPVLVVWPLRSQMNRGSDLVKQDIIRHIAREEQLEIVDLLPFFRQEGGEALFADVVHANVAGHRLVADKLEIALNRVLSLKGRIE